MSNALKTVFPRKTNRAKRASCYFELGWYVLKLLRVIIDSDPGPGEQTGDRVRFTFLVYRWSENDRLIHQNERLDQYVGVCGAGQKPTGAIRSLLQNLGLDPDEPQIDEHSEELEGRYIRGRIGKPDEQGFQRLIDCKRCEAHEVEARLLPPPKALFQNKFSTLTYY